MGSRWRRQMTTKDWEQLVAQMDADGVQEAPAGECPYSMCGGDGHLPIMNRLWTVRPCACHPRGPGKVNRKPIRYDGVLP